MPNRVLGSWLSGPRSSGLLPPREEPAYPGARLGLPEAGSGSLASYGRRLAAFALDAAACDVVALALTRGERGTYGGVVLLLFGLDLLLLTATTGRTLGMHVTGLRIRPVSGGAIGVRRALIRTVLLLLFIPIFVVDRDGRGLHDRLAGTVVVRAPRP